MNKKPSKPYPKKSGPGQHQNKNTPGQHQKKNSPGHPSKKPAAPYKPPRKISASTPPKKTEQDPVKHHRAEQQLYGRHLCATVFAVRPDSIRSVLIEERLVEEFGDLLKWCAQKKIGYNITTKDEIAKIAKAEHHEGILLFVRTAPVLGNKQWQDYLTTNAKTITTKPHLFVVLDGVANPHNLGAILRNAAHFGANAVIFRPESDPKPISAAVARMSEGGSELVPAYQVTDLRAAINDLKKFKCQVIGTSSRAEESLHNTKLGPLVAFVIGSEAKGMSAAITAQVDTMCRIPFYGKLQSLNAATAAALCMGEFLRHNQT